MAIQNEANVEIPLAASTVALYKAKKQTKKQGASCETESIQTTIRERSKKEKKKHKACSDSDSTKRSYVCAGANPAYATANLRGKATAHKCDFRCSTTRLDV